MRRAGIAIGIVVSIMGGLAACVAPTDSVERSQETTGALRNLDDQEQAFLGLINQYRQSQGLAPLTATPLLNQVAWDHSDDMAVNDYFDHNDQQGHSPFDRMAAAGYHGGYMAENIAAGNSDAQSTFTQWKNSPGHNANMLGSHYVAIGIGRAYSSKSTYGWYWTTDFGDYVDPSVNADAGAPPAKDAGTDANDGATPGCTSGKASTDSAHPTPLAGSFCGTMAASEVDWLAWTASSSGAFDLKLAASGDARVVLWQLANGQFQQLPNTSATEVAGTASAGTFYELGVWSPSRAAQSYTVTLR